jgi:hypothetical protein
MPVHMQRTPAWRTAMTIISDLHHNERRGTQQTARI